MATANETLPTKSLSKPDLSPQPTTTRSAFHSLATQLEVTSEVLEGSAINLIPKVARELSADLILLGSHGDTGTRKDEIGSVAAAVVNQAPCSVEVVKLRRGKNK